MTVTSPADRLDPCGSLGFDITAPIWSESVALFVTTPAAASAASIRLFRFPSAGTAWLWVHVFTPNAAWAYNVDHVPCGSEVTSVDGDDVAYRAGGATFTRLGPREAPTGGTIDVEVAAHAGHEAPDVDGETPIRVSGTFTPAVSAMATLPGRSELLGDASVRVQVGDGEAITIAGHAQFHEQHQDNPRFVVPFTYASLRGPDLSLIALIGPRASGGFGSRRATASGSAAPASPQRYSAVRIPEPEGGRHAIELEAGPGEALTGEAVVVHSFTIPVYGRPWWGTLVTATIDGAPLSGSVNRWRFGAQP